MNDISKKVHLYIHQPPHHMTTIKQIQNIYVHDNNNNVNNNDNNNCLFSCRLTLAHQLW